MINDTPGLSAEFRLLIAAARFPWPAGADGALRAACSQVEDWETGFALIRRHQLVSLAARNLALYAADCLPVDILARLKAQSARNQQHALRLFAELSRLNRIFTQAQIPLVALKGPALAQQLFGDIGLRDCGDLDLLTPPALFPRACQLLLANGYEQYDPRVALSPRQWQTYQRIAHHIEFRRADAPLAVELHWQISSPDFVPGWLSAQMLERASAAQGGGMPITTQRIEDTLVYLIIHGARHGFERLKWLVDFTVCLRQGKDFNWEAILAELRRADLQRALGLTLNLCERLFELPIPVDAAAIARQPAVQSLTRQTMAALVRPDLQTSEGRFRRMGNRLYLTRLKTGWRSRWGLLSHLWSIEHDWEDLQLPDRWFPLYSVLRPFLWLRRYYGRRGKG